jgi:hypothetical protein
MELKYCEICKQMTNHGCLKCSCTAGAFIKEVIEKKIKDEETMLVTMKYDDKLVVSISPEGCVTYGEGWNADSASKHFFEHLGALAKYSFDAGLKRAVEIVERIKLGYIEHNNKSNGAFTLDGKGMGMVIKEAIEREIGGGDGRDSKTTSE